MKHDEGRAERDRFSIGASFITMLYPAFDLLRTDLALEAKGFSQLGVVDYSELYRFMHPDYVKPKKRQLLVITHLLLVEPDKVEVKLYLIDLYLGELVAHMKKIEKSLAPGELERILESREVGEFLTIMKKEDLTPYLPRLNELFSFLRANFLTLLVTGAEKKVIESPLEDLIRLFDEEKLHMWKEPLPILEPSELMETTVYTDVKAHLDLYMDRKRLPNQTDALAAAFVHIVNKEIINEKKYAVIYTGSSIPLFAFKPHAFVYEDTKLPIARDLYYTLSRICLFNKYGGRDEVLKLLDTVLPHMKRISDNIDDIKMYVVLTRNLKMVPEELYGAIAEAAISWEVVCDKLHGAMSEILAAISADSLRDWRRTVFKEPPPISIEECKELQDILGDPKKRMNNAEKVINSIGTMLDKLEESIKARK